LRVRIGRFREHILDSCVVESSVQVPELGHCFLDHGLDLRVVRDIAGDSERPVTVGDEFIGGTAH